MTDQTIEAAQPEPAAEYTPDWPAIVNRLSAELEEEREARRAWRRRAEAAGQAPATDQTPLRDLLAAAIRDATCTGDCGQTEEECAKERIQPGVWHHGRLAMVEGTPEQLAAAVLPVLPAPADQTAVHLSDAERTMLAYALDQAQERIWSEGGFTDEDQAAVDSLRRLTAAARQDGAQP